MNEKSGAELAWQLVKARELNGDLDSRDYFDAGFEAGKHLPSGDVGKLREALEHVLSVASCNCPKEGHLSQCLRGVASNALASVPANPPHAHEIKSDGESIGCIHCGKTAEEIKANPPQVDTTLEMKPATEWLEEIKKDLVDRKVTSLEFIERIQADALAHARKSQPKEGVNQRLLKAAAALLAETGKYDLNYITGDDGACGAAESQLMKAVLAAESAVVPSMELNDLLFSGELVLMKVLELGFGQRTSPENVSDVLDAVVKLIRERNAFDARKEGGK